MDGQRSSLPPDCEVAIRTRANLLIQGDREPVRGVLAEIREHLPAPSVEWKGRVPRRLPKRGPVSVILAEVSDLTLDEQVRLLRWMEDPAIRVHLISSTAVALYDLVEQGAFLEALYYRLNTILAAEFEEDRPAVVSPPISQTGTRQRFD